MTGEQPWLTVGPEHYVAWRKAYSLSPSSASPLVPCPVCGHRELFRYYVLDEHEPRVFQGVQFEGRGRLWEWCASCRTFEYLPDGYVPKAWAPWLNVASEALRTDPTPIEQARIAGPLQAG